MYCCFQDAHNCLLDFDKNTSFFAVYDGHGGCEVAEYCSRNLPQFIKKIKAYEQDDIVQALVDGFIAFDDTIATEEVREKLRDLEEEMESLRKSDTEDGELCAFSHSIWP